MDNLFSTHPNVENRIRALEAQAAEMGSARGAARPSSIPAAGRRPGMR
jgi:heat shock protein HtpX